MSQLNTKNEKPGFRRLLTAVGLLTLVSPAPNQARAAVATSLVLEAETGERTPGLEIMKNGPDQPIAVGGFATSLEFGDIPAKENLKLHFKLAPGFYNLVVTAKSVGDDKLVQVKIDSHTAIKPIIPQSSTFKPVDFGIVEVVGTSHVLTLGGGWGYYEIDKLEFIPHTPVPPRPVPGKLSNPLASPAAKDLMSRLVSNYGKRTLSGQSVNTGYESTTDFDYLQRVTGKQPVIFAGDLLPYSPSYAALSSSDRLARQGPHVERLADKAKAGHVVSLTWHWNPPGATVPDGFNKVNYDFVVALNNPGSPAHIALVHDIDTIAAELKSLARPDVPVLWRPLHEASGFDNDPATPPWFWWGRKGPEEYKRLWRFLYHRLTTTHKLDNLIWVWATVEPNFDWYPGDDVVDIVGIDGFQSFPGDSMSSYWRSMQARFEGKKLLALTEFWGPADVEKMQRLGVYWSYFGTWFYPTGPAAYYDVNYGLSPDPEDAVKKTDAINRQTYQSDGVTTLDEWIAEPMWTENRPGVEVEPGSISGSSSLRRSKRSATGSDAGAFSRRAVMVGDWVEFTAGEVSSKVIGLSAVDTDAGDSVQFGIALLSKELGGQSYIRINKGWAFDLAPSYSPNDVFRIERHPGKIVFAKKRGKSQTVAFASDATPLYIDTTISDPDATIRDITIQSISQLAPTGTVVQGVDFARGFTSGSSTLTKPEGSEVGWNTGAYFSQPIGIGEAIEFTAGEKNSNKMVGLSKANADGISMTFGIHLWNDGTSHVYVNGGYSQFLAKYEATDVFRIERVAGGIRFLKNGSTVLKTEPYDADASPLFVDTAIFNPGGKIVDLVPKLAPVKSSGYQWDATDVKVTTDRSGYTLAKKSRPEGTPGWNAGAFLNRPVGIGDRVSFEAGEISNKVIGLSTADGGVGNSVQYGIAFLNNNGVGTASLWINGRYASGLGSFKAKDLITIERVPGSLVFRVPGSVMTYPYPADAMPLYVDTTFFDPGATVRKLRVALAAASSGSWANMKGLEYYASSAPGTYGLRKTKGTGWGAGALFTLQVRVGDAVQFEAGDISSKLIGLSPHDKGVDDTVKFGLLLLENGESQIKVDKLWKNNLGNYVPTDVFRIERHPGKILFLKNGIVLQQELFASDLTPLYVDMSFFTPGATIERFEVVPNSAIY